MSRWQQIEQLFQSVVDMDESLRKGFLTQACGGDLELQAEVESLLETHGATPGEFLDTPALEVMAQTEALVSPPPQSITGKHLGPYLLLDQLGSGGMGEVYRAYDTQRPRDVAVKVMPARLAAEPEFARRFRKEAKLASSLNHPNIISVYSIGEAAVELGAGAAETMLYIAMELIAGQTLYALLDGRALPVQRTLDLASQIAAGLARVHAAGIMHRDLKPQNVMVRHDGVVKILDFGLGKRTPLIDNDGTTVTSSYGPSTNSGTVLGTVDWMSPQQASGLKVDFRSDQFSFGAMLYEMATGRRPFRRATTAQTMAAIIQEQPAALATLNPDVPPTLEAIIMRCLAKDPEQRFASTAELERELAATRDHPERDLPATFVMPAALVEKQVAVLPFTNVGGDPAQQLFCDGLAETLASKLTQLEQFQNAFRVIPASELRQESVTSARAARQTFGATVALSGSVQKTGERLRLTLSLMDTAKLRTLGSRTIDTDMNDIALMQDGIVLQAADLLGVKLSIEEQQVLSIGGTTMPEAYKYYLEAEQERRHNKTGTSFEGALAAYHKAVALDPNYALAFAGMGETYWYKYELTKDVTLVAHARTSCENALRLNPRMATVHVTLAVVDGETGRHEQAISSLQQALKLDPCCAEAYRTLARVYETTGRIEDAEATFLRAVAMRPNSWGIRNRFGAFYFRLGRYGQAEHQFKKILEIAPDNARAYQNLGSIYTLQGRTEEAIAAFEESIELAPHYVLPYNNLAALHSQNNRLNESVRIRERALEIDDRNYQLWHNLAAAYSWTEDEKHKATAAFQRAAELGEQQLLVTPNDVRLQVHLADCYSQLGQPARAWDLVEKALATNPSEVSIYFNAAIVYEQIGAREQAINLLAEAVQRGFPREAVGSARSLASLRSDKEFKKVFETAK